MWRNIKKSYSIIRQGNFILYAIILVAISLLMQLLTQVVGYITDHIYSNEYTLWTVFMEEASDQINLTSTDVKSVFGIALLIVVIVLLFILEAWIVSVFGKFTSKVNVHIRKDFVWSALNLPIESYQERSEGYLMKSASQSIELSFFLSQQMVEVIVRPLLSVYFLVVMAFIYPPCSIVVLVSVIVMILATIISGKYENEAGEKVFKEQSKESGFLLEGLRALRSIRNSGSEFVFFREYVNLNQQSAIILSAYKGVKKVFADLPTSVGNITRLVLILVGAFGVFNGNITLGQLITVHGFYCISEYYIRSAIFSGQDIMSVKYQMENLFGLSEEAKKTQAAEAHEDPQKEYSKLKGNIRIEHLTFGYSQQAGPVLNDISMDIPAGSSVAIVGSSGCGKTTLKKIICSRYEPWEGKILYDGRPASEIYKGVLENSIASVDQQIIMFEDTVMNNIKMWDPTQIDADGILAARDAQIHDEIILREGGYKSLIEEDGSNYSGGQRQRIEIARALSMDPTILIMDEATSALDTIVEKKIVESVNCRGITTIVIAHRLSTIRNCDCIYVMDKGRFVGVGSHDELMKTCDVYRTLVTVE